MLYSIECMTGLYDVEIEPEVRAWLAGLSDRDFGRVDFMVGLLAGQAEDLGEPYTRHLGWESQGTAVSSVTPGNEGHVLARTGAAGDLLTAFRKTRNAETAQVARALQATKICAAEQGRAHDAFDREVK
jgi:hypothetical protein